ncbi:LysE/ArgO family amino acid transporter [Kocuria palustris]|uniref:LysE/ArgO family amino acid transporter n=1 Tax=Kocuria palustris TaxID=71999 RepID=UPI0021A3AC7E|nr:LysE/ArgO family amino acid transporter [Kocuria palustris]MCT1591553.1 LysE/ArgO family amino acid transporter [Kocuria palustris]
MDIYFTGMLTGLALIVAIGAQNAFVLRQGIRREHVLVVVAICTAADALLITVGTLGIGSVVERAPWLLTALRWGGVAYLVWFAIGSFRSALSSHSLTADDAVGPGGSLRRVALTTLALTFLNPHVYLDTMVMLGNLANQHGDQRWTYTLGAITGSVLWFPALGLGARALAKPLNRPGTWRGVDIGVGVVMLLVALRLGVAG